MIPLRNLFRALLLLGAAGGLRASEPVESLRREALDALGRLEPLTAPATPAVELGRALFWDARVSADGRTACASCHAAADGGADRRRFSPDARGRSTARNSQTVFNAMLQPTLRWTGDRKSGAHQAERSLTGSMGFAQAGDVVPVLKRLDYETEFRRAYPADQDPVTPARYAEALQAYQATLVTPTAFDRFLGGESAALNAVEREGLRTFLAVGCADCHRGPLLGGTRMRKFGVAKDYWLATGSETRDAGLFESTQKEEDRYVFRVPMLRNIEATAPYFHDGSVRELTEAVQVMADVQLGGRLETREADAIVAFLRTLTGAVPPNYAPPEAGTASR